MSPKTEPESFEAKAARVDQASKTLSEYRQNLQKELDMIMTSEHKEKGFVRCKLAELPAGIIPDDLDRMNEIIRVVEFITPWLRGEYENLSLEGNRSYPWCSPCSLTALRPETDAEYHERLESEAAYRAVEEAKEKEEEEKEKAIRAERKRKRLEREEKKERELLRKLREKYGE